MKSGSSSSRWLRRQHSDPYVKRAKDEGYRARAAFKLEELHERYQVFYPGQKVLELGAAPGSWSQIALKHIGPNGQLLGVDLLKVEPLPGAEFLCGDFLDIQVQERIEQWAGDGVDLILSDMAPNMSGIKVADQLRAMDLTETCSFLANRWLRSGGALLCKVFIGEGWDALLGQLRSSYARVSIYKPRSSRTNSRETYFYALDLHARSVEKIIHE